MARSNSRRHGERHGEDWHRDPGYGQGGRQGHRTHEEWQRADPHAPPQEHRHGAQGGGWEPDPGEWAGSSRGEYRGEYLEEKGRREGYGSAWQPGHGRTAGPRPRPMAQQWPREWQSGQNEGWEQGHRSPGGGSSYAYGHEAQHAPERRRGPKNYTRTDERIREDVCERLIDNEYIDSSEVSVNVHGGTVILEGSVPERHMKHAIEDMADGCPGVQDVDNKLRVVRPGTETHAGGSSESGSATGSEAGREGSGTGSGSATSAGMTEASGPAKQRM